MLIIVAECEAEYSGRLTTKLERATRLILIKDNHSIQLHADHYPPTGFKPLNWMTGGKKTDLQIGDTQIVAVRGLETLTIRLHHVIFRQEFQLGVEPGLWSSGTEKEMQAHLAAHPYLLGEGTLLVRREHPTPVGPVDLLCTDEEGQFVAVEVKRAVGHIRGVDQLLRYVECLNEEPETSPCVGLYVAQGFKPQTLEYAKRKGIRCLPVTVEHLRQVAWRADLMAEMYHAEIAESHN